MTQVKTIALVTGASSGLGREFCRQLADRCDTIIAVARRAERLAELTNELEGRVEVHPVTADLGSVEGVAHALEMLRQKGPVSILVNNAGFSPYGEFAAQPVEMQRGMLALHCDASMTLCRAAIPFMQELGGGCIINVSSLGSLMPGPGLSVYGATKAFLNYLSACLQSELSRDGIEVQALCPGLVRTEIHEPMKAQGFDPDRFPDEMWMNPEEVVSVSLAALGSGQLYVIPGQGNRRLAQAGAQSLLDSL
jgi:short-subunit dehydrogenase